MFSKYSEYLRLFLLYYVTSGRQIEQDKGHVEFNRKPASCYLAVCCICLESLLTMSVLVITFQGGSLTGHSHMTWRSTLVGAA